MKKIMLIALLLISIGFTPCLCGGIELEIPAADLAALLVRPLGSAIFWHTWDLVFDHFLAHSLYASLPRQQNSRPVTSIPRVFVRRLIRSRKSQQLGPFSRKAPAKNAGQPSNQHQES